MWKISKSKTSKSQSETSVDAIQTAENSNATALEKALEKKEELKEKFTESQNKLTESKWFKKFVDSTFSTIVSPGQDEISKDELYQGLLLVHLKLAKFAGAAACYPPEKSTCDDLFDAADHDNSGGIDKTEFVSIMAISCAQILTRMIMYYLILILFVPYASAVLVDYLIFIENGGLLETGFESLVGFAMFYIAIPVAWNHIDARSKSSLKKKPEKIAMENKDD